MLAWYASSPEHGGNPDLTLASNPPPPTSPAHFRPAMQSPGPPYQGSMGSAMNYSERPYENQMVSHCQTNSYPSYQPPSPYRPHPVSPPAHAHQYGAHTNHQMHSSLAYGAGHQLGPYGTTQAHYASLSQDLYGSRASMYSNSSRAMQMKSAWGDSASNSSSDLMQYSQPSPRPPPMMPPPPIHSPSHGGMGSSVPAHYRQIPIVTPASHSPHSWSQSQIPSPGVLHPHSPRATPSPLPVHSRSPSHSQPFSPPQPPSAPSPHHPPPSMTPHPPPPQKTTPSPPSGPSTPATPAPRQPICNSPSGQPSGSDPLQSLQKMVMLDSEAVESPIARANYEMSANQGNPPPASVSNRPASYFSVEQLAGSDPGSPYPTYYNLDQNRLCTPPRTCMSTPTSSTFSSAPDSTSSNSPRSDSRTTTASADSTNVGHANGELPTQQPPEAPQQQQAPPRRQDFPAFSVADVRIPNGNHPSEPPSRDENGPASSDSENKDTQDFLHHLGGNVTDIPQTEGTVDLSNPGRKSPKSPPVDRRRPYPEDLHCNPALMENSLEPMPRSKPILMTPDRRNSTLPEFEITNGKPENTMEDVYPPDGYVSRPPRYYSPTARWNKMGPLEDGFMGMQSKSYPDEYMPLPKAKRGRKKKIYSEHEGMVPEWDMYNTEIAQRPPRVSRGGARGRRGSRRRGGMNAYVCPNPEAPMDMYSNDPSMMSMRNHPSNGMNDMMVNSGPDKGMGPWSSHNYHMGPPQSLTPDYGPPKESMSVIKPPMMDPHSLDNSMNSNLTSAQQTSQNFQSDVSVDDHGRGPLLFTVNKDGSTVKLQDGGHMSNSSSSQQQYYDPVLGQMVSQPVKKKRGRPFGSKNKPKPPGEERQPRRRRKKEIFFGPEGPPPPPVIPPKIINGPYVRITSGMHRSLMVSVVNVPPKDEETEAKFLFQKRQFQFNMRHQKIGLGPSSSMSPLYDMVTKEKSWLCCLCCKNSHYRELGDLFGPYVLNGEQKPSNLSAPPSPIAAQPHGFDREDEPLEDESRDDLCERRFPGKQRSDVMEQMFRAALLRKAKQANGQKTCENLQENPFNSEFPSTVPSTYSFEEPSEDIKGFWVHEECAVWSKGIYLVGQHVYGLEETIIEAAETICSRCKFPGASLTCAWHECTEHYHYMCARNKWCQMNDDQYTIFCPKHRNRSD